MSGLFGGSKSKSTSKPKDLQAAPYTALRPQVAGTVSDVLSGLTGGLDYSGPNLSPANTAQYAAPVTGQQQGLIDQAVGSVGPGGNPLMDAATGMLQSTLAGNYLSPDSNPFLKASVTAAQDPLMQDFSRTIVPQLLARFTAAGQQVQGGGSSAFANAANNSASDLERNLGNIAAQMYGANYTTERANQMQAATQANTISNDSMTRLQSALQAASLPQLTADLGIQRGLAEYNTRMNSVLQAIQLALGGTQPVVANQTKSTVSQSPNIWSSLFAPIGGSGGNVPIPPA